MERLGHTSKKLAVIDHLPNVDVHVFNYGNSHSYFQKLGYPEDKIHLIDGLMLSYIGGKMDYFKTGCNTIKFYFNGLQENVNKITKLADYLKPNLFISDFEPSIPLAAKKCRLLLISVDNQHRFRLRGHDRSAHVPAGSQPRSSCQTPSTRSSPPFTAT